MLFNLEINFLYYILFIGPEEAKGEHKKKKKKRKHHERHPHHGSESGDVSEDESPSLKKIPKLKIKMRPAGPQKDNWDIIGQKTIMQVPNKLSSNQNSLVRSSVAPNSLPLDHHLHQETRRPEHSDFSTSKKKPLTYFSSTSPPKRTSPPMVSNQLRTTFSTTANQNEQNTNKSKDENGDIRLAQNVQFSPCCSGGTIFIVIQNMPKSN